jgi:hypothetical protein
VDRLEPGLQPLVARTIQGGEIKWTVSVPGEPVELVIGREPVRSRGGHKR